MAGSTPASLTAEAPASAGTAAAAKRQNFSPWQEAWRRFRRHKMALFSAIALAVILSEVPMLKALLQPYVVALQAVPKVAVAPLVLMLQQKLRLGTWRQHKKSQTIFKFKPCKDSNVPVNAISLRIMLTSTLH